MSELGRSLDNRFESASSPGSVSQVDQPPSGESDWSESESRLHEQKHQREELERQVATLTRALSESEAKTRVILDTAPDGILTVNDCWEIESFNRAAELIFGQAAEQVVGRAATQLIPHLKQLTEEHDFRASHPAGPPPAGTREIRGLHSDGTAIPLQISLSRVLLANRRLYTVIVRNISERKQAAELIRTQNEWLERTVLARTEELRGAKVAAEAASTAKSEFLANMSHEIRTPLTAILGFSEILEDGPLDSSQLDAINTIKRNGEYLLKLINDILDLSKIEAGQLEIEPELCSPVKLVDGVAELMGVRADSKGLAIEVEHHLPADRLIQTDPMRLRQILINLIGNAIKFTEVGRVRVVVDEVHAAGTAPRIRFSVRDTGIGLCESQVRQLFRPFTQVDSSSTRRYGGTGLGLVISKRLAQKLGGDIEVYCQPAQGCTFTVTIRASEVPLATYAPPQSASAAAQSELLPLGSESRGRLPFRVLLAEDGLDNQRLISMLLKKGGIECTLAENGKQAYEMALEARTAGQPFAVILMDMQMPVMDGYQAATKLREAGYNLPIVALTAHAMNGDREKCLAAGCDDYMTKPAKRENLLAIVNDHAQYEVRPCRSKQSPLLQSAHSD
jgi:PAS domain S-box-containing protein